MSKAKGSAPEHGTHQAVYPKMKASGSSVKLKPASTSGSGMKKLSGKRMT